MKLTLHLVSLFLAISAPALMAVQARRDIVHTIQQPDGTELSVTLIGDEHSNCLLTTDGLPVIKDTLGRYCYATTSADGVVQASTIMARNVNERSAADNEFINRIDAKTVSRAILSPAKSSLRRANQSSNIGLYISGVPHVGEVDILVVLVAFSDQSFSMDNPLDYYNDFLNGDNFTRDGGTGSCRQYFMDCSNNQFQPTFDVYGPATVSAKAVYGAKTETSSDTDPAQMVVDACNALDSEIDFSKYDSDGDGIVDNVYIIYAGDGEATSGEGDDVWPHKWDLNSAGKPLTLDNTTIVTYGCCNEYLNYANQPAGIGTFCHEFSHVLGLPDLYDTTYGDAAYSTPRTWSVLDYGNYNNDGHTPCAYSVFERNAMGWVDPTVISKSGTFSLGNINDTNQCAVALTSKKNEFFLFENRQQTGWDKYLPGHGMLVWHIDYNTSIWHQNIVNNDIDHQYVDIEEANCATSNRTTEQLAGFPFPGTSNITEFSATTTPSFTTWKGKSLNTSLKNIAENDGVITFEAEVEEVDPEPIIEIEDIVGKYQLSYYNLLNDGKSKDGQKDIRITATSDNEITISDLFSKDITATVDVYTASITINFRQGPLTTYSSSETYACHFIRGNGSYEESTEPVVAYYDKDTETITIDKLDYLAEIVLLNTGASNGYTAFMGSISAKKVEDTGDEDQDITDDEDEGDDEDEDDSDDNTIVDSWENLAGPATFTDCWVLLGFSKDGVKYDPTQYPYSVDVQRNAENHNLIRLVNPYVNVPEVAANNADESAEGCIIFDISDPDFVLVLDSFYCGFTTSKLGKFYPLNYAQYYIAKGYTKEQVKAKYTEGAIKYNSTVVTASTFANNIITINDAVFGYGNNPIVASTWLDKIPMTAKVELSSLELSEITDVALDNALPCEYYNLQGMRIEHPTPGQIYIRRQGTTATKVIYK